MTRTATRRHPATQTGDAEHKTPLDKDTTTTPKRPHHRRRRLHRPRWVLALLVVWVLVISGCAGEPRARNLMEEAIAASGLEEIEGWTSRASGMGNVAVDSTGNCAPPDEVDPDDQELIKATHRLFANAGEPRFAAEQIEAVASHFEDQGWNLTRWQDTTEQGPFLAEFEGWSPDGQDHLYVIAQAPTIAFRARTGTCAPFHRMLYGQQPNGIETVTSFRTIDGQ